MSGRSFGRGRSVGVSEGLVRGFRERIGGGCREVVRVCGRGKVVRVRARGQGWAHVGVGPISPPHSPPPLEF